MLELDQLRHHYESLNDEDLARQHGLGRSAFASAAVWQVVDEVYRARSMAGQQAPAGHGRKTGGDRFSSGTVMLFALLGFASLAATVALPGWWLSRHPPSDPGSRMPGS